MDRWVALRYASAGQAVPEKFGTVTVPAPVSSMSIPAASESGGAVVLRQRLQSGAGSDIGANGGSGQFAAFDDGIPGDHRIR